MCERDRHKEYLQHNHDRNSYVLHARYILHDATQPFRGNVPIIEFTFVEIMKQQGLILCGFRCNLTNEVLYIDEKGDCYLSQQGDCKSVNLETYLQFHTGIYTDSTQSWEQMPE